jgi:hypothetical protein
VDVQQHIYCEILAAKIPHGRDMDLICYDSDSGEEDIVAFPNSPEETGVTAGVETVKLDSGRSLLDDNAKPKEDLQGTATQARKYDLLELLPPMEGCLDNSVRDSISQYTSSDIDLAKALRGNRIFKNPYILTRTVDQLGIDEKGSNYPSILFDPTSYKPSDFEDALRDRYANSKVENDRVFRPFPATEVSENTNLRQAPSKSGMKRSRWDA